MKAVTMENKPDGPPWRIHCPACDCAHMFTEGWAFNLDFNFPTFLPSMLIQIPMPSGDMYTCHSVVKNGCITFLSDCTHDFRGTTLTLPEIITTSL